MKEKLYIFLAHIKLKIYSLRKRGCMLIEFDVPLHTISEMNLKEHWARSAARHKNQKKAITLILKVNSVPKDLPVTITMTRCMSRMLDDDNLRGAFKWIRDALAEWFCPGLAAGRADDDKRITWKYSQEKCTSKKKHTHLSFRW